MLFLIIVLILFALFGIIQYKRMRYPVPSKPERGKKIVACVGDSITFGAGVSNQKKDSYPAYLQKRLDESYQVINYGMSGRTLLSTGDMPYIREKNYKRTFVDHPSVYIIMLGTNDAKPYNFDQVGFKREYEVFLKKYIRQTNAEKIIIMKPPKAFCINGADMPMYDILNENVIAEQEIIDALAEELKIQVVDLYSFTENHPEYFKDGIHPNSMGNSKIADYIMENCFQ